MISGKLDLLYQHFSVGNFNLEKILADLSLLRKTSDRISKIIRGMKTISRNTSNGTLTLSPVSTLLDEAAVLCSEPLRNFDIQFRISCPIEMSIECDKTQISQIIMNLMSNSCHAVSCLEERWIHIDVENIKDSLIIRFSDSGIGIPDAIVNRIMEPFFTTKEIGQGTGLGLSISRAFAEAHCGTLYYELFEGHTSFVLKLPLARQ